MKTLVIAIVLGAVGYFVFFYEPMDETQVQLSEQTETEEIKEEYGIETTSYTGAISETYEKYKKGINDAKDAVLNIEKRDQMEY